MPAFEFRSAIAFVISGTNTVYGPAYLRLAFRSAIAFVISGTYSTAWSHLGAVSIGNSLRYLRNFTYSYIYTFNVVSIGNSLRYLRKAINHIVPDPGEAFRSAIAFVTFGTHVYPDGLPPLEFRSAIAFVTFGTEDCACDGEASRFDRQ